MRGSHHFTIGKSHEICQDYAFSSDDFAALSDGCSRVSRADGSLIEAHTDVGARLLVRAAFSFQREKFTGGESALFLKLVAHSADNYRRSLGMGIETLSSTLICLKRQKDVIAVIVAGDGLVAARRKCDKSWTVYTVRFSGPPFYPRYLLDDTHCIVSWRDKCEVRYEHICSSEIYKEFPFIGYFPVDEFDLVAAASDGMFSFTKDGKSVEFNWNFSQRLLDFRRMGGKFMVRHLRGTLEDLEKDGIVNQDDVSMIGLYAD
jgi:hypothetical protein